MTQNVRSPMLSREILGDSVDAASLTVLRDFHQLIPSTGHQFVMFLAPSSLSPKNCCVPWDERVAKRCKYVTCPERSAFLGANYWVSIATI